MKLKVVGVICPLCGECAVGCLGQLTQQDSWIGYTRSFYHGCQPTTFNQHYMLLYDEHKTFVGIIPGNWEFLTSAGNRVWEHDDEDIPL